MHVRRSRLGEMELEAVLAVANDGDAYATIVSVTGSETEAVVLIEHFEAGMDKLRAMLADRRNRRRSRDCG